MTSIPCDECRGRRLKKEALAVTVGGKNIAELTEMSIEKLYEFLDGLTFGKTETLIAAPILKEIRARLQFLRDVGLSYLTLARSAGSLSGGEAQRIRLATQIGSGLTGVLYILDEPSIGLHQRDNEKLLNTLKTPARSGQSPLSWWSMTKIPCAPPISLWISDGSRACTAARWSPRARRRRS